MRDRLNALEDNLNSVNRLYEEEMKRANDALNTVERMNVNIDRIRGVESKGFIC